MKKTSVIALLLTLVLIVASFVGCGSSDNGKDPAPGNEATLLPKALMMLVTIPMM